MGDDIIVKDVQLIQGGLLQIDFMNMKTGENYRAFSEGKEFFSLLGSSMASNSERWMKSFEETLQE